MSGDRIRPRLPVGYQETNARTKAHQPGPKNFIRVSDRKGSSAIGRVTPPNNRKIKVTLPYVSCLHDQEEKQ